MNKRIQLSPEERREQILRGALKVFSIKGFDATTNKDIAREAGLASPGLIYHYFQDKQSLLRATIEMHIGDGPAGLPPQMLMSLSVEEGLRLILKKFLQEINNPGFVSFIRVLLGEAMRRPEFAAVLSKIMVERMFTTMTIFFKYHIDKGNIRAVDPAIAALRFSGSTLSLLIMREVLKMPAVCNMDPAALEKDLVDDFVKGILP